MVGERIKKVLDDFHPLSQSRFECVKNIRKSIREVMSGQRFHAITLFRTPPFDRR